MTAVLIAVACLMFTAGFFLRSHTAAIERGRWIGRQERWLAERADLQASVGDLCERLGEALNTEYAACDPYREFQPSPWIYTALQAAYAEVIPGEVPVSLTLGLVDGDGSQVAIRINAGERPERSILLDLADGDQRWQEAHYAEVPDTPESLTKRPGEGCTG